MDHRDCNRRFRTHVSHVKEGLTMTTITAFMCDNSTCDSQIELNGERAEAWLAVIVQVNNGDAHVDMHFCRWACLSLWAMDNDPAVAKRGELT
jgi:hypothetical protein